MTCVNGYLVISKDDVYLCIDPMQVEYICCTLCSRPENQKAEDGRNRILIEWNDDNCTEIETTMSCDDLQKFISSTLWNYMQARHQEEQEQTEAEMDVVPCEKQTCTECSNFSYYMIPFLLPAVIYGVCWKISM